MTTAGDMGPAPMVKVGAEAPLKREIPNKKKKKIKKFGEYISESLDRESVAKLIRTQLRKEGLDFKESNSIGYTKFTIDKKSIVWDGVGIDLKEAGKSILYLSGKPKLQYKDIINKLVNK